MHRHSDLKYSLVTNKGDVSNILITCAKVVPLLLQEYPTASFGFTGARTVDRETEKVEQYDQNQRFRIYRKFTSTLFGSRTFTHFEYPQISSYLLINNYSGEVKSKERKIVKMFSDTYRNLPDI